MPVYTLLWAHWRQYSLGVLHWIILLEQTPMLSSYTTNHKREIRVKTLYARDFVIRIFIVLVFKFSKISFSFLN